MLYVVLLCVWNFFMIKGFHRIILSSANIVLQKNDYFDTERVGTRSGGAHL